MVIRGIKKPVLDAASFDFYGFASDADVKKAASDALDKYGCGSCGPRGFYGTIDQHLILEADLAKFMRNEVSHRTDILDSMSPSDDLIISICRKQFVTPMVHQLSALLFLPFLRKVTC